MSVQFSLFLSLCTHLKVGMYVLVLLHASKSYAGNIIIITVRGRDAQYCFRRIFFTWLRYDNP